MTYLIRFALTLIALATSFNAQAGKPKKAAQAADALVPYENKVPVACGTLWLCAYDGRTNIECRLAKASRGDSVPVAVDSRLPKLVGDMLNAPQNLLDALVRIPGTPFDMNLVGQLAEAVMCE